MQNCQEHQPDALIHRLDAADFTMSEVYTGLMLPMIAGSLPDFRPTFEQYVSDLKKEAEKK